MLAPLQCLLLWYLEQHGELSSARQAWPEPKCAGMMLRTQKREPGTPQLSGKPCSRAPHPWAFDSWESKTWGLLRRERRQEGTGRQTRRAPITEKSASGCKVISASHPGPSHSTIEKLTPSRKHSWLGRECVWKSLGRATERTSL